MTYSKNDLPPGFNLLDIGIEPPQNVEQIYTSTIETTDLYCNFCEYRGNYMTLCIKLNRPSPPRKTLFNFIMETEAFTKSLIGEESSSHYIDSWYPAHIIFCIPLKSNNNPMRTANFILTGLQVRIEATINQGALITANQNKRLSRE